MAFEKVVIRDCALYRGDCLEVLPVLDKVDAVVTDPPYGIGESAGRAKTRTSGLGSKTGDAYRKDYGNNDWDDKPIDSKLFDAIRAKGKWQVIFGGNYYPLPPTSCWLVWDKLNGDTDFADCELAWTNLPKAIRRIQYLWNGCMRANGEKRDGHPTQKPLGVMKWCIKHIPPPNDVILDPFMGSGTTGVACVNLGRKFIGIEKEKCYFDTACKRIEKAYKEQALLDLMPEKLKPIRQRELAFQD